MDKKTCLHCGTSIVGRSDKRFCSDQCRATYNNSTRTKEEFLIKNVNKVLRKNRRILKTINPKGMSIVRKEVLLEMGYNFTYFTSIYVTQEGSQYFFCYDLGFLHLEDSKVRIVEYQAYMKKVKK
jgi:predicted nucleic acid-binding Zn ribbon protein